MAANPFAPTGGSSRIDNLPMDRRASGYGRMGAGDMAAIYERRDIDPEAQSLRRRHGSVRSTSIAPNLLGVACDYDLGRIDIDYATGSEVTTDWTIFATLRIPTAPVDVGARLFTFHGHTAYVTYIESTNTATLALYTTAGALAHSVAIGIPGDYRICVTRASGAVRLNSWVAGATPGADSADTATWVTAENNLSLFGPHILTSPAAALDDTVINNLLFYDVGDFATTEYEALASDRTPATSGTNDASTAYKLIWHESFADGGDVLSYQNDSGSTVNAYLIPTVPTSSGDDISFGGMGVIEIPFYLDFDEYYWTVVNASARLEWVFQAEITLPSAGLSVSTVYDFQDIAKLSIELTGSDYRFRASYAGSIVLNSTLNLVTGQSYEVFVGRNGTQSLIRVIPSGGAATDNTGTAGNPAIFNYDKTLGFVIGDTVDQENSNPFGGKLRRFALHNEASLSWQALAEAVIYYDETSVFGDQVLDRGNRALNSFMGVRLASSAPSYKEGGFIGGSYVAAVGGYLMAGSTPSVGYSGELRAAITKDAVVQRRGDKSFLTSNGFSYIIDDTAKSFRPLGVPRPGTKVSSTPQGVGPIDGFVRYAYRYVTRDGTVGPAFALDPIDARDGVNVFLGAEGFGLPDESPFGISYGEAEGSEEGDGRGLTGANTVETFLVRDTDGGSNHNLLRVDTGEAGLTLETAFRIPNKTETKESVFSQGVFAPSSVSYWMADHNPYEFAAIGNSGQEAVFQFCFRYDSSQAYQTLFGVGARDQHYHTGGNSHHWRLNHLVVSIQPPLIVANNHSIVVCRDNPHGSNHRDNDLTHHAVDYDFQDGHDYCVIVRRAGLNVDGGYPAGSVLVISVFNKTLNDSGSNGWALWPGAAGVTEKRKFNFWPSNYNGDARNHVMWGACRHSGTGSNNIGVKTRLRIAAGGSAFTFNEIQSLRGGTTNGPLTPGSIMYHARIWNQDKPLILLAERALDRYGAREGPLSDNLLVDLAFCSDSSKTRLSGGWDFVQGMRVPFYKKSGWSFLAHVFLAENVDETPILTYGWDMTVAAGSPADTWTVDHLRDVPLWVSWSSRNEGSLVIGTGRYTQVEIAEKKWHSGADLQTFDEFAGAIDLDNWTWVTMHFRHIKRTGTATDHWDLWLTRVFLDGNTGDWGSLFGTDTQIGGISANTGAGPHQYGLIMLGGLPGIDQKFEVEIAEMRLWDGERYTAAGGGEGDESFGPYLSARVPPNIWDKLWYYLRFVKTDLDDPETPTKMSQWGVMKTAGGVSQKSLLAVDILRGADVKDAVDGSTGTSFFVPFPAPPSSAIRGIQIFRTQIVPVTEDFPGGGVNPDALSDAWRAARDAPLYYLSEIPRGTTHYIDTATDAALGGSLDATTGLIPRDPGGVFEWENHIGIFATDRPRVYFSEAPNSWESFPTEHIYDLPVREYGPIKAACELASRDARQSRVICLGESWGAFLDGSPINPTCNTLGGGVGASTSRCLVVERGVAFAYNGTLWAITGDGQAEDIGLPVLDLLPDPAVTRLSISSALSSLFVIDESTGLVLRFHLSRRQWYVEDRNALSVTDVAGVDSWVHLSGYPSTGASDVYQDDVESNTPTSIVVSTYDNAANTITLADATGLAVGQRITVVGDRGTGGAADARARQTVTVQAVVGTRVTVEEDLALDTSTTDLAGVTYTLLYTAYPGVGYWGTMLDTGQFGLAGGLRYVEVGVEAGDGWWGAVIASDYAGPPGDRSGLAAPESRPTNFVNDAGAGTSARWGLNHSQRLQRLIFWSPIGAEVGLTELELTHNKDNGGY